MKRADLIKAVGQQVYGVRWTTHMSSWNWSEGFTGTLVEVGDHFHDLVDDNGKPFHATSREIRGIRVPRTTEEQNYVDLYYEWFAIAEEDDSLIEYIIRSGQPVSIPDGFHAESTEAFRKELEDAIAKVTS